MWVVGRMAICGGDTFKGLRARGVESRVVVGSLRGGNGAGKLVLERWWWGGDGTAVATFGAERLLVGLWLSGQRGLLMRSHCGVAGVVGTFKG